MSSYQDQTNFSSESSLLQIAFYGLILCPIDGHAVYYLLPSTYSLNPLHSKLVNYLGYCEVLTSNINMVYILIQQSIFLNHQYLQRDITIGIFKSPSFYSYSAIDMVYKLCLYHFLRNQSHFISHQEHFGNTHLYTQIQSLVSVFC